MVEDAVVAEAVLMCHVAEKAAVDSAAPAASAVPVEGD
jgi:hypothetical protein